MVVPDCKRNGPRHIVVIVLDNYIHRKVGTSNEVYRVRIILVKVQLKDKFPANVIV